LNVCGGVGYIVFREYPLPKGHGGVGILDVIATKPEKTSLVLTGNYAPESVIEAADLVTEMKEIKHTGGG
jgi:hypothetical protein